MFVPLLGRRLTHLMVVFYTVLVCTGIFQMPPLDVSAPPGKSDWLVLPRYEVPIGNPTKKTLALLFPPGLIGGYRNQVMRFIAFVHYAITHDVDQLLLPTMLFTTTYRAAKDDTRFFPVPMSSLFDVEHWNSFSDHLPILVDTIENGDCWEQSNGLFTNHTISSKTFVSPMAHELLKSSAFLQPVQNISHKILTGSLHTKTRKLDLLSQVENCSRPMVYGGGSGAGRLWNDYLRMTRVKQGDNSTTESTDIPALGLGSIELISHVSKALLPRKEWRDVAHQCIKKNQWHIPRKNVGPIDEGVAPYIALHARVEVDMLIHRCSRSMEKNLTKIFNMAELFKKDMEQEFGQGKGLHGIFVAVSRSGMLVETKDESVQKQRDENWNALNSSVHRKSNIFECGEDMTRQWYSSQPNIAEDYYGSVLPSILNFFIATQAAIFIGVSKSSWSTDVWTTRYYQGLGSGNFEYTPSGIVAVPNGGLPPPHGNC